MQSLPKVICLMGPTASGKTGLAVELVQKFPVEIISVDSALIYRGMNIGTAKPDAATLRKAPHRLIDIRDPSEAYSAAQFCEDAKREIEGIFSQGKTPLLVGGTMLYFSALQQGLSDLPSSDPEIRAAIKKERETYGLEALHARLSKVDPQSAARIHPNDPQRIQRALEVYDMTRKSLTEWHAAQAKDAANYHFQNFAIAPDDRSVLHDRIQIRFDEMLTQGFVEEVKHLIETGKLIPDTPAMRSVGYRQVYEYLQGNLTYETMREKAIIATRQLAKRQLTWLRNWPTPITWLDPNSPLVTFNSNLS